MKKLLVAGLVLTVAGSALAASPQPSLDRQHQKPVKKNLSSSLVRHPDAPAQPLSTGTLGRTAPMHPAKEGGSVVTPLNAATLLGGTPTFPSAAQAEYAHLKANNLPIPESLVQEIFGTQSQGGARQGGETWASATAIAFAAGGTYTDSGTTVGSVNDVPVGQVPPGLCNTSFFASSSFGGGDVFYTFTLPAAYEVDASTCNNASYDSCLGIFDSNHNLVAVNDDGTGCTGFSSIIDPCCLAAGTYYVVVDGYGTASGTYTLNVNFSATTCESGCPPVECDGSDEGEPNNGPADFGGDDTYGSIECGTTVCGTTFTDDAAQTRDTDWFELTLTENSVLTINTEAELFDPLLFVIDNAYNILYTADDFGWCEGESITTDCLFAGTYYIWMGHSGFTGVPEEVAYSITLDCEACTIENPCLDPMQLSCGDSVTGTTVDGYNYVGNAALDKFYEVTIDQDGPITFSMCTATDYDSYLRIYDDCPVEGGVEIASNDDSCGLASELTVILSAGTYWVVVEGFGSGVGNYSLDVICSTCEPITCDGDDEGEPNNGPADFGGDDTYGSIECSIASTVCGTTWADADTRDTDWFELLLLEPSILTVTSEAELFDPLMFVLDGAYNILYSADNAGFCEGETITTDCLPAGTYYLWMGHNAFAGVPDEVAYSMTLSCEACEYQDPCDNTYPIACGETVTGESGMSVGDNWDTYCFGGEDGPEVLYSFDFAGGYIEIGLTSTAAEDLDMALLGSCDPLDCLDMPYAIGSEETISGVYPAGTYYIAVDAYGYTGSEYTFDLSLFCGANPCDDLPPVDCTGGVAEEEPNEGWNDSNASYNEITCGGMVCGTTWATGGNRDLDWYHFSHTGGDIEVTTQIGAFDCVLFLTDFEMTDVIHASADNNPMCTAETMTFSALPAGEYYLVIAHNAFEGVDTDQDYSMTLTCLGDPCEGHTPIECDGTAEVEPNEGWNDDNASYNELAEDETVCGSVWADGGSRDLDWFHFTVPGNDPMNVTLESQVDEFNAIVFLLDFTVNGSTYTAADQNGPCTGETINYECLAPGEYFAVIAHNDFEGVPEDQNYSLTLTMGTCTPADPCADLVTGSWTAGYYTVNRPAPTVNHHNAVNGCEGISSAGYDELHVLTLAAPADVRMTMTGSGAADEAIYVLTDCNFTESCIAAVDAGGTDTAPETMDILDMPAGTYYFVADYWGASETHAYALTLRNLTIAVDEDGQPFQFELQGAYPNPFNPTTTIQWTQPDLMPASLAIYNLAGQLVQEFNLGFRGPGVHNFVWNASELSSGVYFYSLTTGGQTLTQKAVLLK